MKQKEKDPPLHAKIQEYEAFLNDVLKSDLQKAQQQKASLQAELKEFEDLEKNINQLRKDSCPPLDMKLDIGGEVLANAHVQDTSRVFISIGLGFHVEVPLEDAPRVISHRKEYINKKLTSALHQVAKIRMHIRMTQEALAQLQSLQ